VFAEKMEQTAMYDAQVDWSCGTLNKEADLPLMVNRWTSLLCTMNRRTGLLCMITGELFCCVCYSEQMDWSVCTQ
jgi:hypothetical protein